MRDETLRINNLELKMIEIEKRLSKIESGSRVADLQNAETKKLSINEFILSKKPKGDNQKTLVIGYFLENFDKLETFNAKDLVSSFERAKEKSPGNINDKVNQNILKGYMMEAREKKDKFTAWLLTNTGKLFVESLPE